MSLKSALSCLVVIAVSVVAFGQNSVNESTTTLSTLQPLEIDGQAEQIEVRQGYESLPSKTVIPASKIQKTNAQNVGEILQKISGVSVTRRNSPETLGGCGRAQPMKRG